jgi:hypothetical protein
MQELNEPAEAPGVSTTCASCGGDPGGLVWEGVVLRSVLTVEDLALLLRGAFDRRTLVRYFTAGQLHGLMAGRSYVIRASAFIADWTRFEQLGRVPSGRRRAITAPRVVKVAAR